MRQEVFNEPHADEVHNRVGGSRHPGPRLGVLQGAPHNVSPAALNQPGSLFGPREGPHLVSYREPRDHKFAQWR